MAKPPLQIPRFIRGGCPVPSQAKVDEYLALMSTANIQALEDGKFAEAASSAFSGHGPEPLQGSALGAASVQSLRATPDLRNALEGEFSDASAVDHCLEAFIKLAGRPSKSVSASDAAAFVKFCLAFRTHCYFTPRQVRATSASRPQVVFVLGGPGAGKGTQCAKISAAFGYHHLSAGDLLREERNRPDSKYGELINSHIKEGKLVPVEITVKLIQQAMEKLGWAGGRFLIDGFPRSFDNMQGWEAVLGGMVEIKFALFFDATETTMEARLIERGKTSGRADDRPASIKKTFCDIQKRVHASR